MTPRPPTHRELPPPEGYRTPTDEEMQRLPEGSLHFSAHSPPWQPSGNVGQPASGRNKDVYAVPITKQEEPPEPSKTLRDEFAMAALSGFCVDRQDCDDIIDWNAELIAKQAYRFADAMLAARNNQTKL